MTLANLCILFLGSYAIMYFGEVIQAGGFKARRRKRLQESIEQLEKELHIGEPWEPIPKIDSIKIEK